MATRLGNKKEVAKTKGPVLPRNKVFVTVGRGIALKGKVRHGGP